MTSTPGELPPSLDEHSRFGWTHPVEVGSTLVDIHKAGSVGVSLAATILASGIYLGAGQESDFGPTLHWHTTDKNIQVVGSTIHEDTETTESISYASLPHENKPTATLTWTGHMSDAPTFNLGNVPASRRLTDPGSFSSFITSVAQQSQEGSRVVRFNVAATSSDETRLDSKAGIGEHDPKNVSLASQYGKFIEGEAIRGLEAQRVDVPKTAIQFRAGEHVSDKEEEALVRSLVEQEGLPDNLALIRAYKEHPETLSKDTRNKLHGLLDRSVTLAVTLEPPASPEVEVTDTITDRCVTTTTVNEKTVVTHPEHGLPIFFVPLVVPRFRRRPQGGAEEPNDELEPEATPQPAEETVEQSTPSVAKDSEPGKGIGFGGGTLPVSKAQVVKPTFENVTPPAYTPPGPVRQFLGRSAVRRGLGNALALATLAAIPFTVKGDVGYCPKPDNHATQNFKWNDIPDYFGARLHLPFTNIDSGQEPLIEGVDCTPYGNYGTVPQEPTCDTRKIVIVDGKLADSNETHYPGATHTITTVTTQ